MRVKLIRKPEWFYRHLVFGVLLIFIVGPTFAATPFSALDIDTPKVRLDAPAFTLENLTGANVSLTDFAGKAVLLNFWATWCAPCREEMPAMQRLWERYREDGFVIVAVAVDKGNKEQVARFVRNNALNYPVLLDPDGHVRKRYEVVGLPMSYLIGHDGKISGRVIGIRNWDSAEADAVVKALLLREK